MSQCNIRRSLGSSWEAAALMELASNVQLLHVKCSNVLMSSIAFSVALCHFSCSAAAEVDPKALLARKSKPGSV
jgi:hypothetical protein